MENEGRKRRSTDSNGVIDLCDASPNDTGGAGVFAGTQAHSRTCAKPSKPLKGILKEVDADVKREGAKRRKKQLHCEYLRLMRVCKLF